MRIMEGYRGKSEEVMSAGKFGRCKAKVEEMIGRRERLAQRNKVESEKHSDTMGD